DSQHKHRQVSILAQTWRGHQHHNVEATVRWRDVATQSQPGDVDRSTAGTHWPGQTKTAPVVGAVSRLRLLVEMGGIEPPSRTVYGRYPTSLDGALYVPDDRHHHRSAGRVRLS